ncbi:mechanosensitive ion channel protein MscS [Halobacteriales archaeon QS_8_69_26]|nr:MAG: mechanosensitive ion channel protein MscS [Halobacteriales archaeon QS_8_69_26]
MRGPKVIADGEGILRGLDPVTLASPLQSVPDAVGELPGVLQEPWVLAAFVLVIGFGFGLLMGQFNKRLLTAVGVPEAVEGTAFERTAQSLGTSTVTILARLSSWFIYAVAIIAAINIAQLISTENFWARVAGFVPQAFIAILIVVVGFVVADKAELLVSERLRGVKLPEVNFVPRLVKYSVLYVAFLVALGQIGVQTLALVALLAVYALAVVLFAGLALQDFLSSGAAGVYLLLNQPYGIGDEVEIGDRRGVVQGMDIVVTRVENDGEEYIIPNRKIIQEGVVRIRE